MKRLIVLILLLALFLVGCTDAPAVSSVDAEDNSVDIASEASEPAISSASVDPGPLADAVWISSAGSGYSTLLRVKSTGQLVFTPYINELSTALSAGKRVSDFRCFLTFTLLDENGLPFCSYEPVEIVPRSASVDTAFDFFLQDKRKDSGFCPTVGKSYNIRLTICDTAGVPLYFGDYNKITTPDSFLSNPYYHPSVIPEKATDEAFTLHYVLLGEGGTLQGELTQTLHQGEIASQVTAIPSPGYYFSGWSDGSAAPERSGDAICTDSWLYARFRSDKRDDHGIPVLSIAITDGSGITDTTTWKDCTVTLSNCKKSECFQNQAATVRGRGNGSWSQSALKKPLKIKLESKRNLLGIGQGKAKDWVLLPQPEEYTFLRSFIAFRMGQLLDGIDYSSGCQLIELYLNGNYRGVYVLAEQVEVQKNRISIDDTGEENDIGYLVELDRYASGAGQFELNGEKYKVKSDWQTDAQLQSIISRVRKADDAIRRGNRAAIEKLIDLDSLIDTYLLHEYLKNTDSGWSSFYFYANKGGKLTFGAPWDFDLSQGSDSRFRGGAWDGLDHAFGYDAGGYDQDNEWFKALWKTDWFPALAAERWYEISDTVIPQVLKEAFALSKEARTAIDANYDLYGAPNGWRSYDDCLAELKNWHRSRKAWLDDHFKDFL